MRDRPAFSDKQPTSMLGCHNCGRVWPALRAPLVCPECWIATEPMSPREASVSVRERRRRLRGGVR
jgi:NMD protein affecting ribosome stability and mRNA decay